MVKGSKNLVVKIRKVYKKSIPGNLLNISKMKDPKYAEQSLKCDPMKWEIITLPSEYNIQLHKCHGKHRCKCGWK